MLMSCDLTVVVRASQTMECGNEKDLTRQEMESLSGRVRQSLPMPLSALSCSDKHLTRSQESCIRPQASFMKRPHQMYEQHASLRYTRRSGFNVMYAGFGVDIRSQPYGFEDHVMAL